MTGHFRKKSIIFRYTREHQEHDTRNRLSISSLSSEKPVAEIDQLKKLTLKIEVLPKLQARDKVIPLALE